MVLRPLYVCNSQTMKAFSFDVCMNYFRQHSNNFWFFFLYLYLSIDVCVCVAIFSLWYCVVKIVAVFCQIQCVLCKCRHIFMHSISTKRVPCEIWRQHRDYRDVIGRQLKTWHILTQSHVQNVGEKEKKEQREKYWNIHSSGMITIEDCANRSQLIIIHTFS